MNYTKGPWKAMFVPDAMPADVCNYGVVGRDGLEVCRCWTEESARFIEAAPDMYEALDELALLVEDARTGNYTIDSFTLQPALLALAKARGES